MEESTNLSGEGSVDFDESPEPPGTLFKYVPRIRTDVIENCLIRFTPLLGTNDIFEVRRTFKKFAGPKFTQLLAEQEVSVDPEQILIAELKASLGFNDEQAKAAAVPLLIQRLGVNYRAVLQDLTKELVKSFIPKINEDEAIEKILHDVGRNLVALSLSDNKYDSVMWSHYAEGGRGFVIEFDTENEFFWKSPRSGESRRLQKVEYFEGQLEELMDDPRKALISKTANWAFEREWRLVLKPEEADVERAGTSEPILLFRFPTSCVSGVLLGYNAHPDFVTEVVELAKATIPHAKVRRLVANRLAGTFSEQEL